MANRKISQPHNTTNDEIKKGLDKVKSLFRQENLPTIGDHTGINRMLRSGQNRSPRRKTLAKRNHISKITVQQLPKFESSLKKNLVLGRLLNQTVTE